MRCSPPIDAPKVGVCRSPAKRDGAKKLDPDATSGTRNRHRKAVLERRARSAKNPLLWIVRTSVGEGDPRLWAGEIEGEAIQRQSEPHAARLDVGLLQSP